MKKMFLLLLVAIGVTGCAKPPKLDITLKMEKQSADVIFVKVRVANTEDHATVPIAIEVTGQARTNGQWDKSSSLLHPAAFVLNKKELREITKVWRVPADAARATLTVKEQESGHFAKTERAEKVFSGDATPATAKP